MANDRLINSTQGESIITGLNTIATKLDALKPISAADNGKVVVNGELTAQTSTTKTANGTYNTTTNNEVIVNVANSYSQSDNGKVVSNQQLVSQTVYPTTVTENDTYDTTNYNSITVNVSGGGGSNDNRLTSADNSKIQILDGIHFSNIGGYMGFGAASACTSVAGGSTNLNCDTGKTLADVFGLVGNIGLYIYISDITNNTITQTSTQCASTDTYCTIAFPTGQYNFILTIFAYNSY